MLREHYAQGRLTVEEFDERLEQLYASKTYGELQVITRDLPDVDMRSYSAEQQNKKAEKQKAKQKKDLRGAWAAWLAASGINWVIWFIVSVTSDGGVYPWPLWVMGPWGVILLVHTIVGDNGGDAKKKELGK
ncbi:DUF1707 domain-containing protein [Spongiactinospora sp. TRM90649]|uniref:DUF1707 SHOCT-like domain-containing protein n=1 Tax=Spongiactinospora sp. TRM90649 TaxID=3031114 RepID=UPI0023F9CDDD|nr:DUF1707 domain-containing protein [Spongiactinospora sp. TRM90649]